MSADLRPENQYFVFTSSLSLSSRDRSTSLWCDHQNIRALGIFVRVGDLGAGFLLFAFILLRVIVYLPMLEASVITKQTL